MHCPQCIVNVYMYETNKKEGKLPHDGGSGGGLIGLSVATQFKNHESCRNLPVTTLIRPNKRMIE